MAFIKKKPKKIVLERAEGMLHSEFFLQSVTLESIGIEELVNCLIRDAVEQNASDIHIEPWENAIAVRIRINGMLVEMIHLPLELRKTIPGRFKAMADLKSHVSGVALDGKCNMGPEFNNIQLRVSIIPTILGEKVVCRIFDPNSQLFDISKLGFDDHTLNEWITMLEKPNGLLLLNGPTGSGKTTAIYASLMHLINKMGTSISVASVEDPVEVNLPTVSQVFLNPDIGFTFASALRGLMRQDPEVIMVGEIRDEETAGIAVQAGLTGHMVLSTVHSGTTAGVFARLLNMDIEPFLLSSSILGILGVRLVRKNCPNCLVSYEPEMIIDGVSEDRLKEATFARSEGCDQCSGSGFSGRFSICELLKVDDKIRDAVMAKKPTRRIVEIAEANGMKPLWMTGIEHALNGVTTVEEIMSKTAADQV
ncbi:MAG: GspE/PulE family protein [Verrucomicrobiales bacterium]